MNEVQQKYLDIMSKGKSRKRMTNYSLSPGKSLQNRTRRQIKDSKNQDIIMVADKGNNSFDSGSI